MELELVVYSCLCELESFVINGIKADYEDFGTKTDTLPEMAEDYCCGYMQFISEPATQQVLDKYKITPDEYEEVCVRLESALTFGSCGWCS